MRLRMFGATDRGLVRAANQDAYFCNAEWGIAIVSDGMGGHKGGERASQLTIDGLRDAFSSKSRINIEDVSAHLDETLQSINSDIHRISNEDENLRGMGATVNYVHFAGGHIAIGHAGDSRTYLCRAYLKADGRQRFALWQLTIDHNVETFLDRGLLVAGRDVPEGPLSERQKSRLTRGMGVVADLKADLYYKKVEEGDIYLTSSDGLHGFVSHRDILQALVSGPIAQAPERLIKRALKAGAPDNVTVVVSIASEKTEPLLNCHGPVFESTPFIARDPSGHVTQIMTADDLIKRWLGFKISNDSEVCASLGKWVFLQKQSQLFRTYPMFDRANVRERLEHIAPQSLLSFPPEETHTKARHAQGRLGRAQAKAKGQSSVRSASRTLLICAGLTALSALIYAGYQVMQWLRLMRLPVY